MQIKEEVQDLLTDVTSYRRQLHQIPELGLEEKRAPNLFGKNYVHLVLQKFIQCLRRLRLLFFMENKRAKL
ncbi:hypothetical protein GCM10025857_51860 [Alicyclobacillus contaminans]|uniref:Uncharacterized protein n=1 Tax=Tetragenococcus osmophilus TaxID=526944 RepID=A0AA38CYB4_9ENTE|nr:hypothetical protein GCM10025857_51860 [Alicyclobacillus contaminans]GMA72249.1 hypothetical protein GCM10025885_12980 [Tetragenococcus osmophilus]